MNVKALLVISSGCAHCPTMLSALAEAIKSGQLAELEVLNTAIESERIQSLNIRSVPWTQIGSFQFEGVLSPAEITHWIEQSKSNAGAAVYIESLLKNGKLSQVESLVRDDEKQMDALLSLFASNTTSLNVRIGIGATIESLEGSDTLSAALPKLVKLSRDINSALRADACHFIGLTHEEKARPPLEERLNDLDSTVREVAKESLETL